MALVTFKEQRRTVTLLLLVPPLCGLAMIYAAVWHLAAWTDEWRLVASVGGLIVAFSGVVAALLVGRCPSCKASLLWQAMHDQPPDRWLGWFMSLEACPQCGVGLDTRH